MSPPLLVLEGVSKVYRRRWPSRRVTFSLKAHLTFADPAIVGVMGPNGAGKTTLFELIAGGNAPTTGRVVCLGHDIHRVKYRERDRLAIHYHQSYQVRRMRRTRPDMLLGPAPTAYPIVHLFDEPQFNAQDGYIGFMLDFFRRLRGEGRLVFVCLHPTETYHLDILRELAERWIFVDGGRARPFADFDTLVRDPAARAYLGRAMGTA